MVYWRDCAALTPVTQRSRQVRIKSLHRWQYLTLGWKPGDRNTFARDSSAW